MEETTIAAISTAMSASGIGIVRISGPEAFEIASRGYRSKGGKKSLKNVPSHTIHYGYIYDNEEMVDEVLVMAMRGPRTYTGEDTIEIDCHGGVLAMKKVLETVLKNGAIIAEPGEFTKRAFLNGRIDLSQAEAVMDVIQSKNEYSLKNSVGQLKGSVRKTVQKIREKLLYHIAYIESALDDPEHYDLTGYSEELEQIVAEEKEKQLAAIIEEENLKEQETRHFMEHAFRDGSVRTTGTDIDKLMPPISRFGGGNRAEKKQTIIDKLQAFFERFFGIG